MVTEGQQLRMNIFDVGMTLRAFRDSRYQSTAFAVAELIDNSVDAEATFVDVLFVEREEVANERSVSRLSEIAVADNGTGMTGTTLVTALRFGGRGSDSRVHGIRGKYGVGLPTSSLSQCRQVDVWTWQDGINNAVHCYLNVDEIESGDGDVPPYDVLPVPTEWIRVMDESISTSISGTLVVWSNLDQVNEKRADTVMRHMEQEVGRIYRHFISDNHLIADSSVEILMSRFDANMDVAISSRKVRPNDPLYLMPNSATPSEDGDPWGEVPMFEERSDSPRYYSVSWENKEYTVTVRYSKAKDDALKLGSTGQRAGNLLHGRHAGRNTGISVVREGRELVKLLPMRARHDERNRWWGCEISFDGGLDALFGVDHNKQMASHLQGIVDEFANSDLLSFQASDDVEESSPWKRLWEIARDVRDVTTQMRREIEATLKKIRPAIKIPGDEPETPLDVSVSVATTGGKKLEEEGELAPTSTSETAKLLDDESKIAVHTVELIDSGLDAETAAKLAKVMVERGDRYAFVSDTVPGSHMFSVKSREGVIYVTLNIDHPAYEVLRELEDSLLEMEDPSELSNACVALRLLLLSWASAEDQYHDRDQRRRVQDVAGVWGRYAATFFDVELAQRGQ